MWTIKPESKIKMGAFGCSETKRGIFEVVQYSVLRGIFKTRDGRQCPVWKTQEKKGVIMSQGFLLGVGFGCGLDGAGLF